MKYASKDDLIASIVKEHKAFADCAASVPKDRFKETGVWGDGWTVHDLFAHLTEWEQMFLTWHRYGAAGKEPALPAAGYTWDEIARLNQAIWDKHRRRSTRRVVTDFGNTYREILKMAKSLSNDELLAPGHFAWTKDKNLCTYLAANTAEHYRAATEILKRWLKSQKK